MMSDVTGHDVGKRAHRYWLAARRSHPPPRIVVQPAQNSEVRFTDGTEFVDKICEAAAIETGMRDIVTLIEARKRAFIAPAEAECPESKHALGVRHVTEHLTDAPFAFGVAELLPRRDKRARLQTDV